MKQRPIWMIAAILTISGASLGLTSCSDNDDSTQEMGGTQAQTPPDESNPTTDRMRVSVTADASAAVLSHFDDNSTGTALVKRLPKTTTTITDDTKFVLIKGSDVSDVKLTDWLKVADVYLKDGYVGIETPTKAQLGVFILKLKAAVVERRMARWLEHFDMTEAQAREAAERSQMVSRLDTRAANLDQITRAIDLKAVYAEIVIFSPISYF